MLRLLFRQCQREIHVCKCGWGTSYPTSYWYHIFLELFVEFRFIKMSYEEHERWAPELLEEVLEKRSNGSSFDSESEKEIDNVSQRN